MVSGWPRDRFSVGSDQAWLRRQITFEDRSSRDRRYVIDDRSPNIQRYSQVSAQRGTRWIQRGREALLGFSFLVCCGRAVTSLPRVAAQLSSISALPSGNINGSSRSTGCRVISERVHEQIPPYRGFQPFGIFQTRHESFYRLEGANYYNLESHSLRRICLIYLLTSILNQV